MPIQIDKNTASSRVYLRGDTYAVKDKIKSIGGHWDADQKAWWVARSKEADAIAISTAPAPPSR